MGRLKEQSPDPETKIRYTIDLTRGYHNLLQKEETGNTQTYLWDGNVAGMKEERREENGLTARSNQPGTCYYFQDELGSPVRLMDEKGSLQETYGYDEFGQDLYGNQGAAQPFGYTGYQSDRITGTYYAQAREYRAELGRFAGVDIIKGYTAAPYTLNEYGYCFGNPMVLVDLDGMLPTWAKTGLKIVAAVAITAAVVVAAPVVASAVATVAVGAGVSATVGAGIATVATATVAGGVIAGGTSFTSQAIDNGIKNVDYKKVGLDAAAGAVKAGTLAAIAVSGGTAGLVSKILINGVVDGGKKLIEDKIDGKETELADLATTEIESILSTMLFHVGDKFMATLKTDLLKYVNHKQNAWDANTWSTIRRILSYNISNEDLKNAFANINSGFNDFYEYELAEALRIYFVKCVLDNDKSIIKNKLMDELYDLIQSLYDYYKNNNEEDCNVTE